MSTINPKRLKVAELREELQNRGLDVKGTKPILVKRLEEALIEEGCETADTSTLDESALDTSTADTTADSSTIDEQNTVDTPATTADGTDTPATAADGTDTPAEEDTAVTPATSEDKTITSPVVENTKVEGEDEKIAEEDTKVDTSQEDEEMEESNKPEAEKEEEESPPESARQEEEESAAEMAPEAEQQQVEAPEDMQEVAPSQQDDAPEDETQQDEDALLDEDDQPEEFQVMDSVGDDMDAPEADQFTEHSGERRATKRRHDDDRDRRHEDDRDRHDDDRERRRRSPSADRLNSEPDESDDWLTATNIQLDRYNCDLSLRINDEGYKCTPLTFQGFAYMWGGARATYGVNTGKVAFEVKVTEHMKVELPEEEVSPHVVRVGFSTDSSSLQLGEVANSYGYGGTAKASVGCKFTDYGQKFGEGDVITAYLDFESSPPQISFARNGEDQGKCFDVDTEALAEQALFPHVLTKNCEYEVNFGQMETPHFPLKEGFTFINEVAEEGRVRGSLPPAKKEDCEIIMMCGLPGSGKTHWAAKHASEHPEKKHYILGTNFLIDKMKVMGLPRKKNYAGRWDVLIEKATKSLNKLFAVACRKKRNYILDQTNVYPSAQRRKMRPFEGYQRKAIVLVPEEEEFKRRCAERAKVEGKDVPDSAVLEMKANFQLPESGSLFDQVEFVELPVDEAQKLVTAYNEEGKAALPPETKRWRNDRPITCISGGSRDYRGGRDNRGGYDNNRDRRGGYNRDRGFDNRRGGGWGNYDDRRRTASAGNYMGYSSNDRRRMESHRGGSYRDNRDSRRDNRDTRSYGDRSRGGSNYRGSSGGWGGQQSWGSQGWGGSGGQGHWNQNNWGGSQPSSSGSYQGQWGSSGQWGNYNNQGAWGQQNQSGWGQGYNYGNQGSSGSSGQGSGQSWGSGYGGSYSGWGK